jgi:hypothetical protein
MFSSKNRLDPEDPFNAPLTEEGLGHMKRIERRWNRDEVIQRNKARKIWLTI